MSYRIVAVNIDLPFHLRAMCNPGEPSRLEDIGGTDNAFALFVHHLSREARERLENPMKSVWKKAYGIPNMISLANGKSIVRELACDANCGARLEFDRRPSSHAVPNFSDRLQGSITRLCRSCRRLAIRNSFVDDALRFQRPALQR